jgi:hypothetical protein
MLSDTGVLRGYINFKIKPLGQASVTVTTCGLTLTLTVVVIDSNDVSLFGHPWIKAFGISIQGVRVQHVQAPLPTTQQQPCLPPTEGTTADLQQLLDEYSVLFTGKLGLVKGHKAIVH